MENFWPIFRVNYLPSKISLIFMVWLKKWKKVWAWLLEIRGTQLSLRLKLISGVIKQILWLKHLGKFTLLIPPNFPI